MLSVGLRGKRPLDRSFLGKIGVRFVFVSFRIWLSLYESGGLSNNQESVVNHVILDSIYLAVGVKYLIGMVHVVQIP